MVEITAFFWSIECLIKNSEIVILEVLDDLSHMIFCHLFYYFFLKTSRTQIVVIILKRSNVIDKHEPPPLCNTRYEIYLQKLFGDKVCCSQQLFLKSTCNSQVNKEMYLPTPLFEASAFGFQLLLTLYLEIFSMKMWNLNLEFLF